MLDSKFLPSDQHFFRAIVHNIPMLISIIDKDGHYLFVNEHWKKQFPAFGPNMEGQSIFDVWPPSVANVLHAANQAVIDSASVVEQKEIFPQNEALSVFLSYKFPVSDASGIASAVCSISSKISVSQASESKDILGDRRLLQAIIENIPDQVYVKDTESRFLLCNEAAALKASGKTPQEMLGKTDFDFFPHALASQYFADEQTILKSGQPLLNHEEPFVNKNSGETFWNLTTKMPLKNDAGKVIGLIGINRDITHLKRLQQQLLQSQKMETVGQLAGGVAHDFNNILMAITGYCELLRLKLPADDPLHQYVDETLKAADRGAALTRRLLAFSRKEFRMPKVIDLNQTLADLRNMLTRLIGAHIELVIQCASDAGSIKADPTQIEQIIMNLCLNARDAMPSGGKLVIETFNVEMDDAFVHLHLGAKKGKYVRLRMIDNGCGMDEETAIHVFEPFFTTKEEGKGTGLGLSTVYGIVKQSNGYITFTSKSGQGSTFDVYFPRIEDAPEIAGAATEDLPETPSPARTILLVDDNQPLRDAIGSMLDLKGYRVYRAESGKQALEIAATLKFPLDVVITDMVMPRMTGLQLAEELKKAFPKAKFIYMSGYTEETMSDKAQLGPAEIFLSKPVRFDALLEKLRGLLTE